jgi:hypothetical protein
MPTVSPCLGTMSVQASELLLKAYVSLLTCARFAVSAPRGR